SSCGGSHGTPARRCARYRPLRRKLGRGGGRRSNHLVDAFWGGGLSTAKRLAWGAAGYVLAGGIGVFAGGRNELGGSEDITQGSPGMVAFGDMILFVLAAGFFGLVPTWFLLRLCVEKIPRVLLATELLVAAMGPASWLAVKSLAGGPPASQPQAIGQMI